MAVGVLFVIAVSHPLDVFFPLCPCLIVYSGPPFLCILFGVI
jgi:hypothetical protein